MGTAVLRNVSQLKKISEPLFEAVQDLKGGARTLVRTSIKNRESQIAIFATEFRVKGDLYKIISLSNISSELEEKEMEAWQNLTQVLAHEIMNSITPIASLSDTVNTMLAGNLLSEEGNKDISEETMNELFAINPDQWLKEMDSIEDFFKEYGDRMPRQLFDEHKKVVDSLKEYSSD